MSLENPSSEDIEWMKEQNAEIRREADEGIFDRPMFVIPEEYQ